MEVLSFPIYGLDSEELPAEGFSSGSGLQQTIAKADGQCRTTRLGREDLEVLCKTADESRPPGLSFLHFPNHPYSTGSWIKTSIGLSKSEFINILTAYDVSPAFLAHTFRQGLAVGSRHVSKETSVKSCEQSKAPIDDQRDHPQLDVKISSGPPRSIHSRSYFHIWYTANMARMNIEVYFRTNLDDKYSTIFTLKNSSILYNALSNPQNVKAMVKEPFQIHVYLLEAATRSWEVEYVEAMNFMNDTEHTTTHAQRERLSSLRIVLLHDRIRDFHRQSLKLQQLAMCIPRIIEVFEDYKSFASQFYEVDPQIVRDLKYLSHQVRGLENKYAGLHKRLELTLQLNYYLMNEKATQVSQEMSATSIEDNKTMTKLAAQSEKLAQEAQKDSAAMKTLTIIAMLALPTTVVSSICGTNFIAYNLQDDTIHTSAKIWIVFVASVASSLVIGVVWWLWDSETQRFRLKGRSTHREHVEAAPPEKVNFSPLNLKP